MQDEMVTAGDAAAAEAAQVGQHDWTGVAALCTGWALTFSVVTASITASNLAGAAFAPGTHLNTLPLSMLLIGWSTLDLTQNPEPRTQNP